MLTNNRSVTPGLAVASTAAFVVLVWATLFGINLHERHQADALIATLRSIRPGATTLEEIRPTIVRFGANNLDSSFTRQYQADSGFYMRAGNQYIARMGERFYFLRYIGLAPWGMGTEIYFKDDRVSDVRLSASVETKKEGASREGFDLSTRESFPGSNAFIISGGHVTGGSRYIFFKVHTITLPADASSDERTHAFAYNLSCVTRFGGCQEVSQVLDFKAIQEDWKRRHPD